MWLKVLGALFGGGLGFFGNTDNPWQDMEDERFYQASLKDYLSGLQSVAENNRPYIRHGIKASPDFMELQ